MFIAGSVMLGIGIHKSNQNKQKNEERPMTKLPHLMPTTSTRTYTQQEIREKIKGNIRADAIRDILRNYTKRPHQAGTDANHKVGDMIHDNFVNAGLEDVHFVEYDVLLSYPDWEKPNHVIIKDAQGNEVFKTTGVSPVIRKDEEGDKYAGNQWLAYAHPGTVTAPVVFAYYGREEHFDDLIKLGINVTGTIALLRYGDGFRGNKIAVAEQYGCVGVILFSDPADSAFDGWDDVFDKSVWMPNDGVQRGSVLLVDGDPLTPLYPAKNYTYRSKTTDDLLKDKVIPTIPAVPVSYSTAYQIFSRMSGSTAPNSWFGMLNVTYKLGPGLLDQQTVTVDVRSTLETRQIRDVVGYIRGATEPDRYVILGNHYDAWVYGSLDPNSGSAILAETASAFVRTMKETGWRPARSIMFANWDAEEYGLMGSTEFTEEFMNILMERAVIYLNMDCYKGNYTIYAESVPMVMDELFAAAKSIENPNKEEREAGRTTVYDTWFSHAKDYDYDFPYVALPAANSDQSSFFNNLGIPILDFTYKNKTEHGTYPLYHSMYETPFVNDYLYDTDDLRVHKTLGYMWTEMAVRFADSEIIPFNVSRLAQLLSERFITQLSTDINKLSNDQFTKDIFTQLALFKQTGQTFITAAQTFESQTSTMGAAAVNSRLMRIERCFIIPQGVGSKLENRHMLFSVSEKNSYAGSVFASIYDALFDLENAANDEEKTKFSTQVSTLISMAQYTTWCAINTLQDFI